MKDIETALIGVVLAIVAFVLGGCNLVQPTETPDTTLTSTPTPQHTQEATESGQVNEPIEIVDEVKDGVYTNYKYGFTIEYPQKKLFTSNATDVGIDFLFTNNDGVTQFTSSKLLKSDESTYYYLQLNSGYGSYQNTLFTQKDGHSLSPGKNNMVMTKEYSKYGDGFRVIQVNHRESDDLSYQINNFETMFLLDNNRLVTLKMLVNSNDEKFISESEIIYSDMIDSFKVI